MGLAGGPGSNPGLLLIIEGSGKAVAPVMTVVPFLIGFGYFSSIRLLGLLISVSCLTQLLSFAPFGQGSKRTGCKPVF